MQEHNYVTEHYITSSINQFQRIVSDTHQMIFHYNDHIKGGTLVFSCTLQENSRSIFRHRKQLYIFIHQKADICHIASCLSRHSCKLDTGTEKSMF